MTVAFALGAVFNAASGSFADWLAAVSTLAAFAAAAFAAVQATGVYRMESARDEQRRQTERRSQPITDETAPPCDQWTWDIALSVRFVDAAGVIWRRNHLGALEEEDSPLPAGELQDPVN